MDGVAVSVAPSSTLRLGKMFVSPAFDYLLIGGLLSWVAGGILYWGGFNFPDNDPFLWWAILVSNWAHFAASTVRLYTKPGAVKTWPFLTLGFPLIAVAVVTAALVVGEPVGRYLFALYLVWSPYHYSRQAYGLSVMYAYRSGSALETADKRWILWACLIPFFWTLIHPDGGMALLLPRGFYTGFPMRTALMQTLTVTFEEQENRGVLSFYGRVIALTLGIGLFALLSLFLIAGIPAIIGSLPLSELWRDRISLIRWPRAGGSTHRSSGFGLSPGRARRLVSITAMIPLAQSHDHPAPVSPD